MNYIVLAVVALVVVGVVAVVGVGCNRAANAADGVKNGNGVPVTIADAKLLRYNYSLSGTSRFPLHSEVVEICPEDSTRCVIRLFDEARSTSANFGPDDEIIPDSVVVSSEVLDSVKRMIVDAKAWCFKENYSPRAQVMDGNSWHFSASFAVTDSMLAATPEEKRPRLLRNGGHTLTSGGSNASPDTKLFEQVRLYLQSVYDNEKSR